MSEPNWRPEVRAFADAMEARLLANDHKGGWSKDLPEWLLGRCEDELFELRRSIQWASGHAVLDEAADVANFAMMIADVCGGLGPTNCAAGLDGECVDPLCPQARDGEPARSGRSCPLPDGVRAALRGGSDDE